MSELQFRFNRDGSCLVSNGQEEWDWSAQQVKQTLQVAKVCVESRERTKKKGLCDCTACQCTKAYHAHKLDKSKFVVVDCNTSSLWDAEGQLRHEGLLGLIDEDNCYLTTYPKWPDWEDRRPRDLEVGECIKGAVYSLSGSSGIYDVYRVR